MDLANKRVLVVGLGKSGVASALFLKSRGAQGHGLRRQAARPTAEKKSRSCSIMASPSKPVDTASAHFEDRT